jgi:hypothetical protein
MQCTARGMQYHIHHVAPLIHDESALPAEAGMGVSPRQMGPEATAHVQLYVPHVQLLSKQASGSSALKKTDTVGPLKQLTAPTQCHADLFALRSCSAPVRPHSHARLHMSLTHCSAQTHMK